MATALVATEFAKTAVKTALGSLVKLIQYELFLDKTVKDGLKSLETELKIMQASIEQVSGVPQGQINPVVKFWASEVKELSCTIETQLQSFMSRIELAKGTLLSAARKWGINHHIASFIKDTMIEAKGVSERRGRYDFSSSNTTSAQEEVDPRIYGLYKKESDLVGLAGPTEELTNMLSNCGHVSIVGMGGLGKTTLARVVYDQMKDKFGCKAFVLVGQNPSVKKVLMDILHELMVDIYGLAPDVRQLIDQVRNFLEGKRCLFVFDDIWDENIWETIHALGGNPESRIITTTRKLKVAKETGTVYMIKQLSDGNSKDLLHTRIFGAEAKIHDTEFARLSEKVLSKCGGVPIAIITIAGLLAKRPTDEWSEVYDSIGFAEHMNEDVVKTIRKILYLSYQDLPSDLKKCFLYLSIFPKDHWIEKNMLIWRWVAEGLVPGVELGKTYFNDLIDRCMIQRATSPRDLGQGGCRIHDMILDFIRDQSSSEKENFSTVLLVDGKHESTSQSLPIHRLAIHEKGVEEIQNSSHSKKRKPNTTVEVENVLSFYASSCPGSSLPRFSKFPLLRVIDLEYCDLSVGDHKLKHLAKSRQLAYMGLLGTGVAELPKKIGGLKLLQTLDVTATGIKELPAFVEELRKLRCLRAGKGTIMMGRVGELESLEELWLHSADKSPDFAVGLRKLSEMRVLVINFDEIDVVMQGALVESLSELKKLEVLQVWFDTNMKVRLPSWQETVPFPKLRQLLLFGVIQQRLMPWIHFECVRKLTKVLLEVEVLEAQDLEILGQLLSLRSLYLHREEKIQTHTYEYLSYTAGKDQFKMLEYLNTNIELVCGKGGFPVIQELEVGRVRVGTDVGLRGNMPLLEKASYHLDCNGYALVQIEKAEAELREASEAHPNRPTLSIKRFYNYNLPSEILHQLSESAVQDFSAVDFWDATRSLDLSGGGEGQANASSASSSFFSMFRALFIPAIGLPPMLTMTDATDDMLSTSQPAGGVPPRRPSGEVQVLLTTTSPTRQPINLKTEVSTEDFLAVLNSQYVTNAVSTMVTQAGLNQPVAATVFLTNMVGNLARNPEFVAAFNSIAMNANGSPSISDLSTLLQLVRREMISLGKKVDKPGRGLGTSAHAGAAATEELSNTSSEFDELSLLLMMSELFTQPEEEVGGPGRRSGTSARASANGVSSTSREMYRLRL